MQMSFYNSVVASTASTRNEASNCWVFFINSWFIGVVFLTTLLTPSCRVEMQKMKVVRPPANVARYTMIFHNRDHGNEENRERWVKNRFVLSWSVAEPGTWGTSSLLQAKQAFCGTQRLWGTPTPWQHCSQLVAVFSTWDLLRTDWVVFPRNFQNYTYIGMI